MDKVEILMLDGTKMRFPAEYAKKIIKKNELVKTAMFYQECIKQNTQTGDYARFLEDKLRKIMNQIRSINRSVPPCGEVIR